MRATGQIIVQFLLSLLLLSLIPLSLILLSLILIFTAHTVPSDASIGSQLVSARAVRRHHDPMDLVSLARDVQQADQFVRATTAGKLQVIVDQIRMLQEQVCERPRDG